MDLLPELASHFAESHPDETAQLLERMSLETISGFLQQLSPEQAARVLNAMMPAVAGPTLADLSTNFRNDILQHLSHRAVAALVRSLGPDLQTAVLEQMSADLMKLIRPLLSYPANTAGAQMDPRVAAWPGDMKVDATLVRIGEMSQHLVDYLYIVDREHKLVGVISHWELVAARPDQTLAALMHPHVDHILATAPRESILVHPAWRRFHSLPVTDEARRYMGVLRYKTLRQMEVEKAPELQNPIHTFLALGELCWTGMSAVWDAMTTVTSPMNRPKDTSQS